LQKARGKSNAMPSRLILRSISSGFVPKNADKARRTIIAGRFRSTTRDTGFESFFGRKGVSDGRGYGGATPEEFRARKI
jgi:hypothetical protein